MTPNAFDDQYIGCVTEMDKCAPDLLKNETSSSSQFKEAWEKSKRHWQTVKTKISPPSGFKDEHGTAIVTYTDQSFHDIFSEEEGKPWTSNADYRKNFRFKAFHYYLTRALQLLRGRCDVMHKETVYRGVKGIQFKHTGSGFMRFGNFASSSLSKEEAEKFGTISFFTIHTCFGVNISNFSYKPTQKEVLIPGHEKFRVTGQENHKFLLWSTNQTCSHFNCALLKGEYRAGQEKHLSGLLQLLLLERALV
uniref:NAD(P)(+)--arginine ADP-ribosyltransferase n=1 Tax=Pelusios castaneus TaxID=367368 RepID=A0A8C8S8Z1_9SAUR